MAAAGLHSDTARFVVWVDSWQQECCGDAWSIGTVVRWTVADADQEYLAPLFASESDVRVDYHEEHHGGLPDDAPTTSGTVVGIRGVQLRYAPPSGGDAGTLYPVPASARLTTLTSSDGPELRWEGFAGYLVEIDTGRA
jgi:hypothetical protein